MIPFVFLLSMLTTLALSLSTFAGVENKVSAALAQKAQARLAARSGVALAYSKLSTDLDYRGEALEDFAGPAGTIDITVAPAEGDRFSVTAEAAFRQMGCTARTTAEARQWTDDYTVAVGDDLELRSSSKIMGDCYVAGTIEGASPAFISGDLYLADSRFLVHDLSGSVIAIDAHFVPRVQGDVFCGIEDLDMPGFNPWGLRAMAQAAGQVFIVDVESQDLTGVLYLERSLSLEDVTLSGVLATDSDVILRVPASKYLKIRSADATCPGTAILAPRAHLVVESGAMVDVYGAAVLADLIVYGRAAFTGPLVVSGDLRAEGAGAALACRLPAGFDPQICEHLLWSELEIRELGYEED